MWQEAEGVLVAQPLRFTGLADASEEGFLEFKHLFDHRRGHGIHMRADANQQRLRDCQRERDVEAEGGALAGRRVHFDAAAKLADFRLDHIHADTATGNLVHLGCSREARRENQLDQATFVGHFVGTKQSRFNATGADALEIEAGAIVVHGQDDFVAFLGQCQRNFADVGFASGNARFARLQTVGNGVAQQVLQRRANLVQHRTVEFDLAAADFKVGPFAEFLGGLPHNTVETLGLAGEGHHANTHQLLLQLAVHSRLREDGRVGVVQVLEQVLLHGGDVVDRLGHHPGQFLEAGEAVEFERVEAGERFVGNGCARLHLRFGLNLDVAQLAAKPDHVFREVQQRAFETDHFAFDPGAGDGEFACLVNQLVDQVGTNPQRGFLRGGFFGSFSSFAGAGIDHCNCGGLLRSRSRLLDLAFVGIRLGCRRCCFKRLAALQALNDLDDAVEGVFNVFDQLDRGTASFGRLFDVGFDGVGDFPQRHRAGHPGTAFQRMEQAMQCTRRFVIGRVGMPGAQIFSDRFGKLSRFFQEDGQQLLVEFVLDLLRVQHESAGSRGCRRVRRFCSGRRQFRYCTGFNCRKFFRRYFKRCRCRRRVELLQRVDQMRHGFRFALVGDIGNHGFKRSNGLTDHFDGADAACLIGCFTTQQRVFERCPEVVECGQAYRAGDTGQRMSGAGHRVRCRQRWFAGDRLKLALQGCQVRTGFF